MSEWEKYFTKMLEGSKSRCGISGEVREDGEKERREEKEEDELGGMRSGKQ